MRLFNTDAGVDALFGADVDIERFWYEWWAAESQGWSTVVRIDWLTSPRGVRQVLRWFRDTAVAKAVAASGDVDGKAWVDEMLATAATQGDFRVGRILFRHLARRTAARIVRGETFWYREVYTATQIMQCYVVNCEELTDDPAYQLVDGVSSQGVTADVAYRVLDFCYSLCLEGNESSADAVPDPEQWRMTRLLHAAYMTSAARPTTEEMAAVFALYKRNPCDYKAGWIFVTFVDDTDEEYISTLERTVNALEANPSVLASSKRTRLAHAELLEKLFSAHRNDEARRAGTEHWLGENATHIQASVADAVRHTRAIMSCLPSDEECIPPDDTLVVFLTTASKAAKSGMYDAVVQQIEALLEVVYPKVTLPSSHSSETGGEDIGDGDPAEMEAAAAPIADWNKITVITSSLLLSLEFCTYLVDAVRETGRWDLLTRLLDPALELAVARGRR